MIELLILYLISSCELTMYGIRKNINDFFAPFTKPSFGVIKPALKRLEKTGMISTRKTMSDGGKQSIYYSITNDGIANIKELLLKDLSKNPVQFLSTARIKLACASILNDEERNELFHKLKIKSLEYKFDAENILNNDSLSLTFYQRITIDNAICEYQNLANLIENLEKENGSNS